jgi:ketosteroid isomerase-like protein
MGPESEDQSLSHQDRAAILKWLTAFETAVRTRDFAAGRALCAKHVVGFGTVAARADGLDQLESAQWQCVWPVTEGFAFDPSTLRFGGQAGSYWVAAAWSSSGSVETPFPIERRGRATLILRNTAQGLLAIHTHFSIEPSGPSLPNAGGSPS